MFGKNLTGYQRLWAKRTILGKSFTMVAPTGVGKTTFGMVASLWLARKGKKSALIFPTVTLVKQTLERLRNMSEDAKIIGFYSSMGKEEKKKFEESFEKMTTTYWSFPHSSSPDTEKNSPERSSISFSWTMWTQSSRPPVT